MYNYHNSLCLQNEENNYYYVVGFVFFGFVVGIWNDRSWSSACYVFGICKDSIPSETRFMWNSGAQRGGEDCG
jgi:hypothetical protein